MPTGLSSIDPAVNLFYDGVLLHRATPYLVHALFGQKRPIDQKRGNVAKFRRYSSLPASTAPLVEGVTPTALAVSKTDITATVYQYGAYIEYTDRVVTEVEDAVLTEFAELLGDHAGLSLDHVYRDVINGGLSVYRGGAVALRSSIATKITQAELRIIKRTLRKALAQYYTKSIKASTGVGSLPIRASFYVLVHPDVVHDLEALGAGVWIPVHQYPDGGASAHENEVGSVDSFRFIESTEAKVFADSGAAVGVLNCMSTSGVLCDVYSCLVLAPDAYGIVDIKGKAMENIIKPIGSGDDALNQRGTTGWKAMTTAVILNDNWMMRYEVLASE
jgi:N4-gp56 family major capsid protein